MGDSENDSQPRFPGPGYGLAAFRRDLFRGEVRWLCTVLAVLSAGLLGWAVVSGDEPAVYYPVLLRGPFALAAIAVGLVVWLSLAAVNWVN